MGFLRWLGMNPAQVLLAGRASCFLVATGTAWRGDWVTTSLLLGTGWALSEAWVEGISDAEVTISTFGGGS